MKLHEEFKLYENLWESIDTSAVVFVGNKRNEKTLLSKVAKTNPAHTTTVFSPSDFLRQYAQANKERVKFYTDAEGKAELEKACADMPNNMKKKVISTTVLVEWKAANGSKVNATSSSQPTTTTAVAQSKLTWEDLLAKADELLDDLVGITGNVDNDDGDGYWQSEYDTWCYRYLYYSATLENTAQLDKLCIDYSKKLPNVEFYFVEDDDLEISEIGYTATRQGPGITVANGASGAKSITEDWYGADSEVEFETSVYPDIAKYFGLKDDEVVTYAYYYTDEVIVNYDDATGRSHEIEKHVPLDQVEAWFKAGYTILDEAKKPLTEARSVADIEAEITRLQQELEQAKVAEKKASYGGTLPKTVWTWDIYLEPTKKGTWTGIKNDLVFETEDKALDAAWKLLNELDDEGELRGDPDDYYVEAFEIPLSSVSKEVLKYSNLTHLI